MNTLVDWIHHWIIILLRPSRPAIPLKSIQIEFRKLILVKHGQHSIYTGWFKVERDSYHGVFHNPYNQWYSSILRYAINQTNQRLLFFFLLIIYPSKCSTPERAQHRQCHSVLGAPARINHHLSREVAKWDTEIYGKTGLQSGPRI